MCIDLHLELFCCAFRRQVARDQPFVMLEIAARTFSWANTLSRQALFSARSLLGVFCHKDTKKMGARKDKSIFCRTTAPLPKIPENVECHLDNCSSAMALSAVNSLDYDCTACDAAVVRCAMSCSRYGNLSSVMLQETAWSFGIIIKPFKRLLRAFKSQSK